MTFDPFNNEAPVFGNINNSKNNNSSNNHPRRSPPRQPNSVSGNQSPPDHPSSPPQFQPVPLRRPGAQQFAQPQSFSSILSPPPASSPFASAPQSNGFVPHQPLSNPPNHFQNASAQQQQPPQHVPSYAPGVTQASMPSTFPPREAPSGVSSGSRDWYAPFALKNLPYGQGGLSPPR